MFFFSLSFFSRSFFFSLYHSKPKEKNFLLPLVQVHEQLLETSRVDEQPLGLGDGTDLLARLVLFQRQVIREPQTIAGELAVLARDEPRRVRVERKQVHRRPQFLGELRGDLAQTRRVVLDDRFRVMSQKERVGEHAVVVVSVDLRRRLVLGRVRREGFAPLPVEVHRQLPTGDEPPKVLRGGGVRLQNVLRAPPRGLDGLHTGGVEARPVPKRAEGPRLVERRPVLDLASVLLEHDLGVARVVVDDFRRYPAAVLVLEGLREVPVVAICCCCFSFFLKFFFFE